MTDINDLPSFSELGLPSFILQALTEVGYEKPSPIQAACIPPMLEGRDMLGQAQTGTGKTAAFALPLLSRLDMSSSQTQVLVLAPTRELAIQVAEAFQKYAHHLKDFHVLPIYGGSGYDSQLRQLRRGAQVIVGTPGRVMDHMRRGTLKLDNLRALVLDEADEMLRMGFIDDVEWVLEQAPKATQIVLFSATMPQQIQRVAENYLKDPQVIKIAAKTTTATTIRQRYWMVSGLHKLDALTRMLEVEEFDGVIIFVRTKVATEELAEKLSARGYAADALNGDVQQNRREIIVSQLKQGKLDILVATDVAARGLDVERVSHVINYDIPYDPEAYVHRIGRTGRAGRSGEAILFVTPREKNMLRVIERATRQPIESMTLPTKAMVNQQRIARFKKRIADTLDNEDLDMFYQLVEEYQREAEVDPLKMAAALARMAQGDAPLILDESVREPEAHREIESDRGDRRDRGGRSERGDRGDRSERKPRRDKSDAGDKPVRHKMRPDVPMQRFRLAVGYNDGVKPGNIVGAIANEADIDSQLIGGIEIYENYSTVDLPAEMDRDTIDILRKARVCNKPLNIVPFDGKDTEQRPRKFEDRGGNRGERSSRRDQQRGSQREDKFDGERRPKLTTQKSDLKSDKKPGKKFDKKPGDKKPFKDKKKFDDKKKAGKSDKKKKKPKEQNFDW
jgi:ATP-dependent RNA helicase DeaD